MCLAWLFAFAFVWRYHCYRLLRIRSLSSSSSSRAGVIKNGVADMLAAVTSSRHHTASGCCVRL